MPVAVFIVGCAFKTEKFSTNVFGNMLVVSLGVAIASYGEAGCLPIHLPYQLCMAEPAAASRCSRVCTAAVSPLLSTEDVRNSHSSLRRVLCQS